ncbi:MAG TPA: TRAP transporter small permease [Planctomycetota bacterium]|nr:TRAP transporter small permease [Planctomycetota bacterium]
MASISRLSKAALDLYFRLLKAILALLMIAMIVPVSLQIISRYTTIVDRFIWTEEAARFCFVWIVMLGSMVAVRDGSHFNVELFASPKTDRERGIADLIVHVLMLLFAIVFVWHGSDFARFGLAQTSEMSGINMLSIYIAFPLAGITWAVFLLEKIASDLRLLARRHEAPKR